MTGVDYLVEFLERGPDGAPTRRTERLATDADQIGAYREASRRWLSGSAAGYRFNLAVMPAKASAELERV